jgi:hypothetical protein
MQATRATGPSDPRQIDLVIKTSYVGQLLIAGSVPVTVTNGTISARIPGGPGAWSAMRVKKISVYGYTTDGSVGLEMLGTNAELDVESATFEDYGTAGSIRPNIHVHPAFVQRMRWYPVASAGTIQIATVIPPPASSGTVFEFSLELISEPLAPQNLLNQ